MKDFIVPAVGSCVIVGMLMLGAYGICWVADSCSSGTVASSSHTVREPDDDDDFGGVGITPRGGIGIKLGPGIGIDLGSGEVTPMF